MAKSPTAVLFDAQGNQVGFTNGQSTVGSFGAAGLLLAGKQDGADIARWILTDSSGRVWVNVNGTVAVTSTQLPVALVGGRLDTNLGSWLGSTAPTVGQKTMANSVPVVFASDQPPINVSLTLSTSLALPRLINIVFDKSDGAIAANTFKRVLTYTVPAGYNSYLISFTSFQNEFAVSRLVVETGMGSHSFPTSTYTSGSSYTAPQFVALVQAEVTTVIQAGPGNVVLTVTYTDHLGTAGRVGTITVPRGSLVGSRWSLVLQAGDIGVRSIQSVVNAPLVTGVVKLLGLVQLTFHENQSTTNQVQTLFQTGIISYGPGTIIGVEYNGGTVSKQRTFDMLLQLVAV